MQAKREREEKKVKIRKFSALTSSGMCKGDTESLFYSMKFIVLSCEGFTEEVI